MASMADIKALRERTGAGIMDCKKALSESGDDIDAAIDWLRAKGIAKATKKAGRAASEGIVASYIHAGGTIGVLIEVNCETDFAARSERFQEFVKDIAMHIAASAPEYVRKEEVPDDAVERERQVQIDRVVEEGKPRQIAEKIVEGRMSKYFEEVCLLEQKFVKDDKKTIEQVLGELVAVIGENVQIRRFARYVLGEGLEKRQDDLAEEVAKLTGGQA